MTTHQIKDLHLIRDGEDMSCPWTSAKLFCGSWCPFFDLMETPGGWKVSLYCAPCMRMIILDKEAPIVESQM